MGALRKHLDGGGRVFIEITKGARKGTIGELVIPSTDVNELWADRVKTGMGEYRRCKVDEWHLKFDDRENVIKISKDRWDYKWNGILRFNCEGTVWVYETKEKPKVEPVKLFDHFGTPLEAGQVVLFQHGKQNTYHNRFGKIKRISDKGTIWVEMFKTRPEHTAEVVDKGIYAQDMFVLDGDLREKAMMAKLCHS